ILLNKGIIEKHKESILTYYRITLAGISAIPRMVVEENKKVFTPPQPEPPPASQADKPPAKDALAVRAHKFGIAYPLADAISPDKPTQLLTLAGISAAPIKLKNSEQAYFSIGTITARLTNRALLLYTNDIYTDNRTPSIEAEAKIKAEFDAIALKLELKLQRITSFRLRRIDKDTLESHITTQHWAEEHHPAAEASNDSPIMLAKSPIDGNARLGIDKSKGFRELETYHSKSADIDKDTLDEQFNGVLDHKISLLDIPRLNAITDFHSQAVKDIDQRMLTYATNIEAHANAIKDLSLVAAKLNTTLDQLAAIRQQPGHRQGFWLKLKAKLKQRVEK
ncbi:MAG: hypothetical protein QXL94_09070, partial [Candidatus Parvarchaeum sp.]